MKDRISMDKLEFGPRRAFYAEIKPALGKFDIPDEVVTMYEDYDLVYRTLCGILYNYVPKSGHPGGSISSGRMVAGLLFDTMDYRIGDPECLEADLISYAAGHKAMGLYAMWALRNELARIGKPSLLPDEKMQLRFEDLVGFRRNPTQETPLFKKFKSKALDGHPTPLTPFVKLSTGASGVGVTTSFGLGFGAMDTFGAKAAPWVHVIEGEGGMTPGRVAEAMATAASAQLWNLVLHVDWNQASIDSNAVCRDGDTPGEYVQWNPIDFCYLHDWNVIYVEDGTDIRQVLAAQQVAKDRPNEQPTAIVYRTTKGWHYGIEGRKSHGAGHDFCSDEFYATLKPLEDRFGIQFPRFPECDTTAENIEKNFWDVLSTLRGVLEKHSEIASFFAGRLADADARLTKLGRTKRTDVPNLGVIYTDEIDAEKIPEKLVYKPGTGQTLRAALGEALGYLNGKTGGAFLGAAADLLGSTSINKLAAGFDDGFYNAVSNPGARLIATGGICEDNMGGFMAGVSTYGTHIGAGSSYGAFIAALQHITARLHGIGQQARYAFLGEPYRTWIMVCAHAGLKTGEDGPTHADPQALQLLQE
ncbi:MAG TPA: hypothetical protein ENO23_02235, partial [Alphaproteobacteria bacterium]|nr:hypothetical protein [Alphaproteobacteria bacterium]